MMRITRILAPFLWAALAVSPALAAPAGMAGDVKAIDDSWAHVAYEMEGSSHQAAALNKLDKQAAAVVARYPGQAEPLLWQGIVLSEEAKRANIFHKLGLAKRAYAVIQKAYAIDPRAGNGGVAMSLGVLYYRVPGSPIGFGDKDKAGKLLRQALAQDPGGMDANYFYGDYLNEMGDSAGARKYLQKALQAPRDPGRPVWDAGRRKEIRALLAKIS